MRRSWPLLASCLILTGGLTAAEPVDYARDVKPILTKNCYACHGPDKQRSSLRLDTAALALKGGNNGPAFVAGQADESRLIKAVTGADNVPMMPPKEPRLKAAEIATLRAWIGQGAKAPHDQRATQPAAPTNHLAFNPPIHRDPPSVQEENCVRNAIDRFVLARLEKEGLKPSPEADRVTLIRRVTLDLTGLPPTPAEV